MEHTICHFEIPVDDLKRAETFYSELFGWKITPFAPDDISMVHTVPIDEKGTPTVPGVNGMLIKKRNPQHPFANYINVESVDEYLAKVVTLGGEMAMPKTPVPGMGYFAYFKDPEGNVLGLWELNPSAA
jgi:predicted enzyme related to lactoylglutathione lyase